MSISDKGVVNHELSVTAKVCMTDQSVFSVNLVCKKELNHMLKVSETSSQGAVGKRSGTMTMVTTQSMNSTWQSQSSICVKFELSIWCGLPEMV